MANQGDTVCISTGSFEIDPMSTGGVDGVEEIFWPLILLLFTIIAICVFGIVVVV